MNTISDAQNRKVVHFSSSLNDILYLEKIQTLSDEDLVKLNEELTHVSASIKANFLYLEKRFELDYDLDDSKLIRARKKYYYIKKFVVEVDRERERRFQKAQGISFNPDEFGRAMSLLKDRRKNLFSYALDVEAQAALRDLLKEEVGEEKAKDLFTRARVIANCKLTNQPILIVND